MTSQTTRSESPAGASQREKLRAPFSKDSLDVLRLRLENAVLRGRDTRRGPMSSEEKVLRQFGSEMFRFFFKDSGSVADRFSASLAVAQAQPGVHDGLRVKLTIEPGELADLPWEYAFDASSGNTAQNYLCLRHQSPFVRYPEAGHIALAPTVERPLRVLGMVANPSGDWTLAALARAAGSSRTVVAERFTALVGMPPMHYLAQWRLQLAANLLATTPAKVAAVGEQVGYDSEAAFSRAFKRAMGRSPADFRAERQKLAARSAHG